MFRWQTAVGIAIGLAIGLAIVAGMDRHGARKSRPAGHPVASATATSGNW